MGTSPLATPDIAPSSIPTPRLAPFSLDAPAMSLSASETAQDRQVYEETSEAEIQQYMRQTRLWRVANSAQWVAWGIVQAKVAALEEEEAAAAALANASSSSSSSSSQGPDLSASQELQRIIEEAEESEFDYLAYSQDRALFFWADVLSLGLIRENELPNDLLKLVKPRMINY